MVKSQGNVKRCDGYEIDYAVKTKKVLESRLRDPNPEEVLKSKKTNTEFPGSVPARESLSRQCPG